MSSLLQRFRWLMLALGHAPALRILYGESLPKRLVPANVAAVALTLVAVAVAVWLAPRGSGALAGVAVWSLGHVIWGVVLATALSRRDASEG